MIYNVKPPYDNPLVRLFAGYGWDKSIQYYDSSKVIYTKIIEDSECGIRYSMSAEINKITDPDVCDVIYIDILSEGYEKKYSEKYKYSAKSLTDSNFVDCINNWMVLTYLKYIKDYSKFESSANKNIEQTTS